MALTKCLPTQSTKTAKHPNNWRFSFPNTADFNFNYYEMLDKSPQGIGRNEDASMRIAVIGAGIAGVTAARELFRSGYQHIDIYESSNRIGGRLWSEPVPDGVTTYEMGAMRMPFFAEVGSENCVLDFYRKQYDIHVQEFPNPGANVDTGIYINDGYGPNIEHPYAKPTLDVWKNPQVNPPPGLLAAVHEKFFKWHQRVTAVVSKKYNEGDEVWRDFWQKMVNTYWSMNFRDLVFMDSLPDKEWHEIAERDGNFGGLGMSEKQSKLFYVIGMGDGGWGAFYDISALYPIRTIMFGFSTNLQLIQGIVDPRNCPGLDKDADMHLKFLGVQSFADAMYYYPVSSWNPDINGQSLHSSRTTNLFLNNGVTKICRKPLGGRGVIEVQARRGEAKQYDHVIMTAQNWAWEMSIKMEGFDPERWPFQVRSSMKLSHNIASSKVFFPLKERFWEHKSQDQKTIPQVIVTDTYLQGIYGYAVKLNGSTDNKHAGTLLISYTWEDDSLKLLADSDDTLAESCLQKLDAILSETGYPAMSQFIDTTHPPKVFHWTEQPDHRGCAKLYRERTWNDNYTLLRYNQNTSPLSHLYFAGESYSVEGGWTEPALRLALDAVFHVIRNSNAQFNNPEIEKHYPKYDNWSPNVVQDIHFISTTATIL